MIATRPRATRDAVLTCLTVLVTTLVLASAAARVAALDRLFVATAGALAAAGLATMLAGARYALGSLRLGPADHVTALRIGLVALAGALLLEPSTHAAAWVATGAALVALALDGVDGWLARRTRSESAFGARLDMETDAALILVLATLCWHHGKAGAWVLASGLLRYVFVAAARTWPALAAPLPPSRRRQVVCVAQVTCLVACLAPVVDPGSSAPIAALGLALLGWSFAVDVHWLAGRARQERHQ